MASRLPGVEGGASRELLSPQPARAGRLDGAGEFLQEFYFAWDSIIPYTVPDLAGWAQAAHWQLPPAADSSGADRRRRLALIGRSPEPFRCLRAPLTWHASTWLIIRYLLPLPRPPPPPSLLVLLLLLLLLTIAPTKKQKCYTLVFKRSSRAALLSQIMTEASRCASLSCNSHSGIRHAAESNLHPQAKFTVKDHSLGTNFTLMEFTQCRSLVGVGKPWEDEQGVCQVGNQVRLMQGDGGHVTPDRQVASRGHRKGRKAGCRRRRPACATHLALEDVAQVAPAAGGGKGVRRGR
jgi:hypothetical protein